MKFSIFSWLFVVSSALRLDPHRWNAQLVQEGDVNIHENPVTEKIQHEEYVDKIFKNHFNTTIRLRRNRRSGTIRGMVEENRLHPSDFAQPLFIHDKKVDEEISSMPGCKRQSLSSIMDTIRAGWAVGVKSYLLFPRIADDLKSPLAEESYNAQGLIPMAIRAIKKEFPDVVLCSDVALDPYNSDGHDGVLSLHDRERKDSDAVTIDNDATIHQLVRQALVHAAAGADYVSPSDMMDGRVAAIRKALDDNGFHDTGIMSYSVKYASGYYSPFRDALDSHPIHHTKIEMRNVHDKKTYQQNPANAKEAIMEAQLDQQEGADIIMVKPGLPYLDIINTISKTVHVPIAVYHVSLEYSMIKAAAQNGWLNEREIVLEQLLAFKRAGAKIIISYYAIQAAQWLSN